MIRVLLSCLVNTNLKHVSKQDTLSHMHIKRLVDPTVTSVRNNMSDNGQEPPKVYHDIAAAFKFCRTLSYTTPIVAFYSPCLEPLPQQELDEIQDADYSIVAIVNTEKPGWWSESNPDIQWDYGTHVQTLASHPKVAAVILRSQINVSSVIAQSIDMYVLGHFYPIDLLENHTNDLTMLMRDMTLITFGIRPKYAMFGGQNFQLNASLVGFVYILGLHLKCINTTAFTCDGIEHLKETKQKNVELYNAYILAQSNHYKYIRKVYSHAICIMVAGINHVIFQDRSLECNENIMEYHLFYHNKNGYLYEYTFKNLSYMLLYAHNVNLRYLWLRGLGHSTNLNTSESVKKQTSILPMWYIPNFKMILVQPFDINATQNSMPVSAATTRFVLYTVNADHIVRFRVLHKHDQKWE